MRMQGMIQDTPISILIDSGSSYTFLSDSWATKLSGLSLLTCSMGVQVANGARLCCSQYIADGVWQMGCYKFSGAIRLLPLTHYDMIIGRDWLEAHSPMQVHWKHKWMSIPYHGSHALLQGVIKDAPPELLVHLSALRVEDDSEPKQPLLEALAGLLKEFEVVFAAPTELPPQRDCDHVIPLVPRAKPVYIRPYRYPLLSRMK
jgi:hypothetical protein